MGESHEFGSIRHALIQRVMVVLKLLPVGPPQRSEQQPVVLLKLLPILAIRPKKKHPDPRTEAFFFYLTGSRLWRLPRIAGTGFEPVTSGL